MIRRILFLTIGGIFIVFSILFFFICIQYQQLKPDYSEKVEVRGILDRVAITWDSSGVIHIAGTNETDIIFASGYVSAQERLWQMELMRRLAKGQLSEIFGSETVEIDKLSRVLGLDSLTHRNYNYISDESRGWVKAYANGINAYLDRIGDDLPLEFILMNFKPERWSPQDCMLQNRLMAWFLNFNWKADILYGGLAELLPQEKFQEIWPEWMDYPHIIKGSSSGKLIGYLNKINEAFTGVLGMDPVYAGSNSWVIAPKLSQGGSAMLANDPHLQIQLPSIWIEMHLSAPELEVAGFSLPGSPGIIIGRNRYFSWGLTNGMIDDCDYFIENIDTVKNFYRSGDKEYPLGVQTSLIKIKDQGIKQFKVYSTSRGPLINPVFPDLKSELSLSLKWTGWENSDELRTFIGLAKGKNWKDFKAALSHYVVPAQNFVYADVSGNIGYQLGGKVPLRSYQNALIPQKAASEENRWTGWVPFDRMPSQINPVKGYIVTANNRIIENSPYYFSELWEPPYRAVRIEELLSTASEISMQDMAKIQSDGVNILARETLPLMLRDLAKGDIKNDYLSDLQLLLKNWDYNMEIESISASFFEMWSHLLIRNIFKDEMSPEYFRLFTNLPNFYVRIYAKILKNENSRWFDDINTEDIEMRADLIQMSFAQAVDTMNSLCGEALRDWRWGKIHQLKLSHVLGRVSVTDRVFNRGPHPVAGNLVTVNVASYNYSQPYQMIAGPSLRFLMDWSFPGAYESIIPGGNSGNFLSQYYDNQFDMWLAGGYKKVYLKVPASENQVILLPSEN